jgi:hypothetical protein
MVHRGGPRSLPDHAVAALAATQRGLVTTAQLLACGLSARQVASRVARGWLHRVHVGVYAVGAPVHTFEARCLAACLATEGVLSHGTGGAVLGFCDPPWRPHVTVDRRRRNDRPGIVVHSARRLDPRDVTEVDGLPVLTGPRCLLDRAAQVSAKRLDRELSHARRLGLAPTDRVLDVVARHPGRAGGPALAKALLGPFTRSELEVRFLELLRTHHAPLPRCNVLLLGFEADCVWEDRRLVVELDGRATHGITAQLARDAAKDATYRAAGWRVERLTWWDVVRDPGRALAVILHP